MSIKLEKITIFLCQINSNFRIHPISFVIFIRIRNHLNINTSRKEGRATILKRTCLTTLTQIKTIHDGHPLSFFRRHSLCNQSEFLSLRTQRVDYAKVIDPSSARVAYCVVLWGDCSLGGTGARNRGCSGVNRLLFGFLDFFLALRCVSK